MRKSLVSKDIKLTIKQSIEKNNPNKIKKNE